MSKSWTRWLWLAYLVCGLVAAGASRSLPDLAQSIVYDAVGLSAVVAILCGVRPSLPRPMHSTWPAIRCWRPRCW